LNRSPLMYRSWRSGPTVLGSGPTRPGRPGRRSSDRWRNGFKTSTSGSSSTRQGQRMNRPAGDAGRADSPASSQCRFARSGPDPRPSRDSQDVRGGAAAEVAIGVQRRNVRPRSRRQDRTTPPAQGPRVTAAGGVSHGRNRRARRGRSAPGHRPNPARDSLLHPTAPGGAAGGVTGGGAAAREARPRDHRLPEGSAGGSGRGE
jgi:hypothetical protein